MSFSKRAALVFILFFFAGSAPAIAQPIAELASAEGKIEGHIGPNQGWAPIPQGQQFAQNDGVRTLDQSRAAVKFATGYLLRMNEKTTINFDRNPGQAEKGRLNVLRGVGHFFSRTSSDFPKVNTPHVSASVRGTEFVVAVEGDTTVISVLDGAVHAENDLGEVSLGKGEQALTKAGSAPVKQILVRPADAVQWALYYPAVFSESDFSDLERWRAEYERAVDSYRRGDVPAAISALQARRDPPDGMSLLEASLRLSAGQVDEAERILSRAGTSALVLAQRSIIALVRNEKQDAEQFAVGALELDRDSPAAHLALSYVRQSQFRLDESRDLLRETVRLAPDNAVAQARLAELLLGFGERDEALRLADAALAKDPDNAYALSVRGFSALVRYEAAEAERYFSKAAESDPGFALPRLGLGLARIRRGELSEGRANLEVAALLDPLVSLYRSYLGKAYYEEERDGFDFREYERAIELDPLDPTPYLYRSYSLLSDHRPIEALENVEASIERNENRAVFRSRLLLDQDQGTRSSSLGQIYNRLGFTELARVEAIRALNRDYSNYSAHFLLADLYRDTHLNSRAQVTENLLGRLLSPVTFNANAINIGGEASLNEYTSLFDRPTERLGGEVVARSQTEAAAWRGDYTKSTERLGFNLGYAGGYRDGFRDNDWLRTHQIFSLGQYGLTADDTLVWDAAVTANDQGDIIVNFDPDEEDPDFESKFDGTLVRAGYHRRLGPGTHLIAQAFYNYGDFDGKNNLNPNRLTFLDVTEGGLPVTAESLFYDGKTDERTSVNQDLGRADIQLVWDTEPVTVVAGTSAGVEHLDNREDARISDPGTEPVLAFLDGFPLASSSSVDETTSQTFLYTTWHLLPWLDFDAGLTYSWLEYSDNAFVTPYSDETFDKDQWGPKTGMVAELTDWASLRLAYSRSLDRTGRGGLGPLEPTFVGGFNQVFDGVRGSESDLYGAGIDFKFETKTYLGVSYQRRELDLDVPVVNGGLTVDRDGLTAAAVEQTGRLTGSADIDRVSVYLYQIFGTSVAGVFDYNFESFDENDPFPDSETNRFSATANYFHPSGFFTFSKATFRYQERAGLLDEKETSNFWILDAGVGYEFDHRHGAITLRFDNILDRSFHYSAIADEDSVLPRFGAELALTLNY